MQPIRVRSWPWLVDLYRASRAGLRRIEAAGQHAIERRRLERFRDRHRGQRCFVIGNGPSLRGHDLSPLAREATFVTNHFYLHPQLEVLQPTYYCVSDLSFFDWKGHPHWPKDLSRVPATTILLLPVEMKRRVRSSFTRDHSRVHYLRCDRGREIWRLGSMSVDVSGVLYTGDTVTLDFCLPLAHFMGFSEVYLLGCDTDYGSGGAAAHFYETSTPSRSIEYHRDAWHQHVTRSYAIARRVFETSGRRIYNATAGGRLEVFPRVTLEDVLGHWRAGERAPGVS
jgi:hypothetical protein